MEANEIKDFLQENAIHTVELGFADMQGVLRGKRVPARHFLKILEEGFALCKACFVWDIQCGIFPGVDLASFDNGFFDIEAKPLLDTLTKVPWREGSAFALSEVYDEHGGIVEAAPREVLKRVLKKAGDLGYRPLIGAELEFYLLDSQNKPLYDGIQCYSLFKGSELEFVLQEIRLSLEQIGIYVEASNTEYGPAQVEINLEYGDALTIADNAIIFKNAVKEIARKHGLRATFMAKPWAGESASGFHVHQSLWDLERKGNLFATDDHLAQQYLAGILHNTRDLTALGSPSVNSYKRFRDHSFAPVNVTWGHDNRTVATRTLLGHGNASRIENRAGAADANPYLIIAANVAAGLDGIINNLTPPPASNQNAYLAKAPTLPGTLDEALSLLESSKLAREYFGNQFVDTFLAIGRHEVSLFNEAVTDWERDRYLEMA